MGTVSVLSWLRRVETKEILQICIVPTFVVWVPDSCLGPGPLLDPRTCVGPGTSCLGGTSLIVKLCDCSFLTTDLWTVSHRPYIHSPGAWDADAVTRLSHRDVWHLSRGPAGPRTCCRSGVLSSWDCSSPGIPTFLGIPFTWAHRSRGILRASVRSRDPCPSSAPLTGSSSGSLARSALCSCVLLTLVTIYFIFSF
jgi:hypothetical protein